MSADFPTSDSVRVETIVSAKALASLRTEWNELASVHGGGLPFRGWEWNECWWRHFHEERSDLRDFLSIRVFRTCSGELVGVAPLMLTHRSIAPGVTLRYLDFLGADPNITELRGVLCDPRWEAAVHGALFSHLAGATPKWDCVAWRGLRACGPAHRLLMQRPHVRVVEEIPDHVLALPDSWDSFKASRPRNVKESLRKCFNSLRRDGHTFAFEVASRPSDVQFALARFLQLHKARADHACGIQHPDVFASAVSRRFLYDLCSRLAARDAVRIFQLRIRGEIVATRLGFVSGNALYLYYSGYDPEWARYSVMTTTLAEAIRYAIEAGFRSVNLATGDDVSKTRWRPDRIVAVSAIEPSPSLRGRLALAAYCASRRGLPNPLLRGLTAQLFGRRASVS